MPAWAEPMEHWAGYSRTDGTLGRLDDGDSWAGAGAWAGLELGDGGHRRPPWGEWGEWDGVRRWRTGRESVRRSGTVDLGQP
jgi:hypothetical protein